MSYYQGSPLLRKRGLLLALYLTFIDLDEENKKGKIRNAFLDQIGTQANQLVECVICLEKIYIVHSYMQFLNVFVTNFFRN